MVYNSACYICTGCTCWYFSVPSVLSFGRIIAEGATNVIPPKVNIDGTFRCFDEDWRNTAHQKIKKICAGLASAFDVEIDVTIVKGYPVLVNNKKLTK